MHFFRFLCSFAFMIEMPPKINPNELPGSPKSGSALAEKLIQLNDEYLYWTDVKYKAQSMGLSSKELWREVKESRLRRDVVVWPEFGLHFSLTDRMQRLCHEFDLNFGGSWGAMKLFPQDKLNQELYLISSVMEEAISSSQMEGASTTREIAKEMLRSKKEPRDRSQRMIANNFRTIQFISSKKNEPLTPQLLLQAHELMTAGTLENPENSGRFRINDDVVVGNDLTGEIVHRPPTHTCLESFAEKLCDYFNNSSPGVFLHPIIKGLVIHFLIAYYHPFADGNGRTARALFYWYMMKENYWLVEYLSISRIIYKSKSKYEKSFLFTENDGNDLGYFITYNLDVLSKAFDELKRYLQKKQAERKRADRFMHLDGISHQQSEIVRMFYDDGDTTLQAKDVAVRLGVSRVTAKSYLDGLVTKGILKRLQPDGRTHAYARSENFDEIVGSI